MITYKNKKQRTITYVLPFRYWFGKGIKLLNTLKKDHPEPNYIPENRMQRFRRWWKIYPVICIGGRRITTDVAVMLYVSIIGTYVKVVPTDMDISETSFFDVEYEAENKVIPILN